MAEETYSSEGPQCPHCGFQLTADEPHYHDENNYTEETCPNCEQDFAVEVDHSTIWTCSPKKEPTQ